MHYVQSPFRYLFISFYKFSYTYSVYISYLYVFVALGNKYKSCGFFMHFATALVVHVPYELFHVENVIDGEKDKISQPQQHKQRFAPDNNDDDDDVDYTNNNNNSNEKSHVACVSASNSDKMHVADLAYAIIR